METPLSILIVDDDPFALTLLGRYLTDAGHSVVTAPNGAEALRMLLADGPPIVITDWSMPVMDGLELCRAIRSHEGIAFAYVIMLTATGPDTDQITAVFDAGADDYLCKPFKHKELLARLRAGERIVRLHQTVERRNRELHRVNAQMAVAYSQLGEANEKLNRLVMTDELTGLINRREAIARLSSAWAAAERRGSQLSCIMMDIDRFKHCNDAYGHAAGDAVLKETSRILRAAARRDESVCRIGGEEFFVICPQSSADQAAVGAERLRRAVADSIVHVHGLELRMTISAGVAERTPAMHSPDDMLRAADHALYAAKHSGRNRVCLAEGKLVAAGPPPMEAPPASGLRDVPSQGDVATVLVVDQDTAFRQMCRETLEAEGHSVVEADNGGDALKAIQQALPGVIIMDATMPGLDGLACTRQLKADADTAGVPIIVTSDRSESLDIIAGLEAGADEFLTKPLNPRELCLRVRTMIRLQTELQHSNEVRGEQSRALGIVSEFTRTITTAQSLDTLLELTLTAVAELSCSGKVCILLPNVSKQELSVARSMGITDKAQLALRVPIGADNIGTVFQSASPLLVTTAGEIREAAAHPDAALFATPTLATPLYAMEHTVGVLVVSRRPGDGPFSALDLEYIELTCNIAAAAIADYLSRQARDDAEESIVVGLAKLAEHRDSDTGRHLDRVTRFSVLLAQELRRDVGRRAVITEEFIADLQRAVPLHDIGKVAVPDYILLKPGPLTRDEMSVMRTHASIGARTIRSLVERVPGARFLCMAEQIAFGHHEWFDGSGYPAGIAGDAIPLAARIVAVADVYDAVTTKRVYKKAGSHDQAVAIITRASGTQFDPVVVDAFLQCEQEFRRLASELADEPKRTRAPQTVATLPEKPVLVPSPGS